MASEGQKLVVMTSKPSQTHMLLLRKEIDGWARNRAARTTYEVDDDERDELYECFSALAGDGVGGMMHELTWKELTKAADTVLGTGSYHVGSVKDAITAMDLNHNGTVSWPEWRSYMVNNWNASKTADDVMNQDNHEDMITVSLLNGTTVRLVDLVKHYRRKVLVEKLMNGEAVAEEAVRAAESRRQEGVMSHVGNEWRRSRRMSRAGTQATSGPPSIGGTRSRRSSCGSQSALGTPDDDKQPHPPRIQLRKTLSRRASSVLSTTDLSPGLEHRKAVSRRASRLTGGGGTEAADEDVQRPKSCLASSRRPSRSVMSLTSSLPSPPSDAPPTTRGRPVGHLILHQSIPPDGNNSVLSTLRQSSITGGQQYNDIWSGSGISAAQDVASKLKSTTGGQHKVPDEWSITPSKSSGQLSSSIPDPCAPAPASQSVGASEQHPTCIEGSRHGVRAISNLSPITNHSPVKGARSSAASGGSVKLPSLFAKDGSLGKTITSLFNKVTGLFSSSPRPPPSPLPNPCSEPPFSPLARKSALPRLADNPQDMTALVKQTKSGTAQQGSMKSGVDLSYHGGAGDRSARHQKSSLRTAPEVSVHGSNHLLVGSVKNPRL